MNTPLINTGQPTTIQQQKPLDIKLTGKVACDKCGGIAFIPATVLRSVSAVVSPSGKPGFYPIDTYCCAADGHINEQFLPIELRTPKIV